MLFTTQMLMRKKQSGPSSPVLDGLVLWYDGTNNTGSGHSNSPSNWYDLSGNGNHGTLTSITWDDTAAVFNGTTSKVVTPYKLPSTSDFTVEVTFVIATLTGSWQTVISQYASVNHYRLRINPSNRLAINTENSSQFGTTLSANTKYNVCAVRSGGNDNAYLDNVLDITKATAMIEQTNTLIVGAQSATSTSGGLNGKIMSVRVYNRALTEEERAHNYAYDIARYPAAS